jgi:hypothetical protein
MSIARQHLVRRIVALILVLPAVPLGMAVLASPAAAAPLATACPAGGLVGTTYTLTGDCAVTAPITVPDGVTLDGGGFTISATDAGGPQWNGGIVTNAVAGGSMNIRNVTITGPANGFQACGLNGAGNVLYGIFFNDASGTVTNVTVDHIYQQQTGAFASCQTGRAIRADGLTGPRTLTITGTTVRDYQKSGFEARGSMTMDVTASTAGPPHPLEGLIAQNAVSLVNVTAGSVANNTIHGSSDQAPGPDNCGNCGPANGTGVLLFGASNVTVTRNNLVGNGTDIGISVSAGSTGNTISFNSVTRTQSTNQANTDGTGIGINVEPDSSATLICNTFAGWNANIVGAIQITCTPLPHGAECQAYSASPPTVEGDATEPFTWSVMSGNLPPGLALAPNGVITGNSPDNTAGTYTFTLHVDTANNMTAMSPQEITIAPGCQAAPNTPLVRTVTSHDRVTPGQPISDRIHVSGLAGGQGAIADARLYGPFTSRAAATCQSRFLVRTEVLSVDNGWNRTPTVRLNAPGVYTWQVTLRANAANQSATHPCGLADETTTVAKRAYAPAVVNGGFSGTLLPPDRDRRAPTLIRMPAIGLRAHVYTTGLTDGRMRLPGDVSEVGWLHKSAGAGDMIGTTVIAGHVSDRHDIPGALYHLSRAQHGQRVAITQAGHTYRFKVVASATFPRDQTLPRRYFTTEDRHRLVLISCTGRVVFPNGHFHYTRYQVVVANQIRPGR